MVDPRRRFLAKRDTTFPPSRHLYTAFLDPTDKERSNIPLPPSPPVQQSYSYSIIGLECRRNKWWNHPLPSSCEAQTIPPRPRFTLILLLEQRVAPRMTRAMCFMVTTTPSYPLFRSSFRVAAENRSYIRPKKSFLPPLSLASISRSMDLFDPKNARPHRIERRETRVKKRITTEILNCERRRKNLRSGKRGIGKDRNRTLSERV